MLSDDFPDFPSTEEARQALAESDAMIREVRAQRGQRTTPTPTPTLHDPTDKGADQFQPHRSGYGGEGDAVQEKLARNGGTTPAGWAARLYQRIDALEAEREALRTLIASDAHAMTFQTMGHYRTALLKALTTEPAP